MGTYADESPDASVGERVVNSVKKIAKAVTGYEGKAPVTANASEERQLHDDASTSSNTGPSGQSTDSYNKY